VGNNFVYFLQKSDGNGGRKVAVYRPLSDEQRADFKKTKRSKNYNLIVSFCIIPFVFLLKSKMVSKYIPFKYSLVVNLVLGTILCKRAYDSWTKYKTENSKYILFNDVRNISPLSCSYSAYGQSIYCNTQQVSGPLLCLVQYGFEKYCHACDTINPKKQDVFENFLKSNLALFDDENDVELCKRIETLREECSVLKERLLEQNTTISNQLNELSKIPTANGDAQKKQDYKNLCDNFDANHKKITHFQELVALLIVPAVS